MMTVVLTSYNKLVSKAFEVMCPFQLLSFGSLSMRNMESVFQSLTLEYEKAW